MRPLLATLLFLAACGSAVAMGSSEEFTDREMVLRGRLRQTGNAPFIETVFSAREEGKTVVMDLVLSPDNAAWIERWDGKDFVVLGLVSCRKVYYATKDGRYRLRYTMTIKDIREVPINSGP